MTTADVAEQLCVAYDLGQLIRYGDCPGASHTHQMLQLTTVRGLYAVKKLHPFFAQQPDYLRRSQHSLQLATDLHAQGFPVNTAIQGEHGYFTTIATDTYLVFPWLTGHLLADSQVTVQHIHEIALYLVRLHQVRTTTMLSLPVLDYVPDLLRWQSFRDCLVQKDVHYASVFAEAWPMLCELSVRVPECHHRQIHSRVLSHGDCDPRNVLWRTAQDFTVIDWEWGGQMPPLQDAWAVALSWSRVDDFQWDPDRLHAFWQAYNQPRYIPYVVDLQMHREALMMLCSYWLEWVDWTAQRALVPNMTAAEQHFTKTTISTLLETINYLYQHIEHFISHC